MRTRLSGAPRWRRRAGAAAAVLVALTGIVTALAYGPPATLPMSLTMAAALGVLAAWPYDGRRIAAVTGGAGIVSLAATAGVLLLSGEHRAASSATGWMVGWRPAPGSGRHGVPDRRGGTDQRAPPRGDGEPGGGHRPPYRG
ncbi:hypothetical protein ACWEN6_06510 [Sphaerisporangium sp. NPDC004334]